MASDKLKEFAGIGIAAAGLFLLNDSQLFKRYRRGQNHGPRYRYVQYTYNYQTPAQYTYYNPSNIPPTYSPATGTPSTEYQAVTDPTGNGGPHTNYTPTTQSGGNNSDDIPSGNRGSQTRTPVTPAPQTRSPDSGVWPRGRHSNDDLPYVTVTPPQWWSNELPDFHIPKPDTHKTIPSVDISEDDYTPIQYVQVTPPVIPYYKPYSPAYIPSYQNPTTPEVVTSEDDYNPLQYVTVTPPVIQYTPQYVTVTPPVIPYYPPYTPSYQNPSNNEPQVVTSEDDYTPVQYVTVTPPVIPYTPQYVTVTPPVTDIPYVPVTPPQITPTSESYQNNYSPSNYSAPVQETPQYTAPVNEIPYVAVTPPVVTPTYTPNPMIKFNQDFPKYANAPNFQYWWPSFFERGWRPYGPDIYKSVAWYQTYRPGVPIPASAYNIYHAGQQSAQQASSGSFYQPPSSVSYSAPQVWNTYTPPPAQIPSVEIHENVPIDNPTSSQPVPDRTQFNQNYPKYANATQYQDWWPSFFARGWRPYGPDIYKSPAWYATYRPGVPIPPSAYAKLYSPGASSAGGGPSGGSSYAPSAGFYQPQYQRPYQNPTQTIPQVITSEQDYPTHSYGGNYLYYGYNQSLLHQGDRGRW